MSTVRPKKSPSAKSKGRLQSPWGTAKITQVAVVYGDFHIFEVWSLQAEPAMIIGMDVLGTVRALAIDFQQSDLYLKSGDMQESTVRKRMSSVFGSPAARPEAGSADHCLVVPGIASNAIVSRGSSP
jgi:hypothetical protein